MTPVQTLAMQEALERRSGRAGGVDPRTGRRWVEAGSMDEAMSMIGKTR